MPTTLYLTGPEGIRAWAERRYSALIEAGAGRGRDAAEGQLRLRRESAARGAAAALDGGELNPNYTFDRFVIGERQQARPRRRPGRRRGSLGGLQPALPARPARARQDPPAGGDRQLPAGQRPGLSVRYTTAESFTNEFVVALKSAGAEAFKTRYRDLDVLLIDDVQFLEGKPATEEEFFHTFNALYESGSQLVLSADRIPSELSTLASRLRDRFEWGLTVAVEPPNLATRLTVLRRLVQEAGVEIADTEALTELANRIDANVRQLHGALTRVIAHASLMAKPLSSELIAEVIPRGRPAQTTSVEEIQQRVAEAFGVSRAELVGSSRAATPLRARQVAIFLTRELTDLSLPQIGRLYGGRDHSTVLNSLRRVEAGLIEDPSSPIASRSCAALSTIRPPASADGRWHCKNPALPTGLSTGLKPRRKAVSSVTSRLSTSPNPT